MGAVNPFRVVDGTNDSYARTNFYTRSTNKHDHQRNIQTAFPQDIHAAVFAMIDRVSEYRNHHDLIRDAVIHRLAELEEWYGDGEMSPLHREMMLLAEQERVQERNMVWRAVIEGAEETFDQLVRSGDVKGLRETIRFHEQLMVNMDPHVVEGLEPVVADARKQMERME